MCAVRLPVAVLRKPAVGAAVQVTHFGSSGAPDRLPSHTHTARPLILQATYVTQLRDDIHPSLSPLIVARVRNVFETITSEILARGVVDESLCGASHCKMTHTL